MLVMTETASYHAQLGGKARAGGRATMGKRGMAPRLYPTLARSSRRQRRGLQAAWAPYGAPTEAGAEGHQGPDVVRGGIEGGGGMPGQH